MNITTGQKMMLKRFISYARGRSLAQKLFFNFGLYNIGILFPLEFFLLREAIDTKSLLDLGCGRHSFAAVLPDEIYSVGVDIFEPYLAESARHKRHDHHIRADLSKLELKEKTFDTVMLLDVLEHFSKEDGLKVIKNAERWARNKVIIFTPNGFVDQHEYDANPHQLHKSGWDAAEMKKMGYKLYGIRGLKSLKKADSLKVIPEKAAKTLSRLSQPVTYFLPQAAYQLFCVKRIK